MQNSGNNMHKNYKNNINFNPKRENPFVIIVLSVILFLVFCVIVDSEDAGDYNTTNSSYAATYVKTKEDRATYIPKCTSISYTQLARNPYMYVGVDYKFTGEVIQVTNGNNNNIEMRVNVTPKRYEYINETYYEDTMYVTYQYSSSYESKILEGDIITMYGTFWGIQEYISILGAKIAIPRLDAKYIDIK